MARFLLEVIPEERPACFRDNHISIILYESGLPKDWLPNAPMGFKVLYRNKELHTDMIVLESEWAPITDPREFRAKFGSMIIAILEETGLPRIAKKDPDFESRALLDWLKDKVEQWVQLS
ncbi:MAG: hypothetical protein ACOYON_08745 [Fimbriimonas sp.]